MRIAAKLAGTSSVALPERGELVKKEIGASKCEARIKKPDSAGYFFAQAIAHSGAFVPVAAHHRAVLKPRAAGRPHIFNWRLAVAVARGWHATG